VKFYSFLDSKMIEFIRFKMIWNYAGAFSWTDNSAVFYGNWAQNEPNGVEGNERCTEVYSPSSEWNDVNCQSKRGFICQIKQGRLLYVFTF